MNRRYLIIIICLVLSLLASGLPSAANAADIKKANIQVERVAKHTDTKYDAVKSFDFLPSGTFVLLTINPQIQVSYLNFYDKGNNLKYKITGGTNEEISYMSWNGIIFVEIASVYNTSYSRLYAYDEKTFKLLWKREFKGFSVELRDVVNNQLLLRRLLDNSREDVIYYLNPNSGNTITTQKYPFLEWEFGYSQTKNDSGYLVTSQIYKLKYQLKKGEGQVDDIFQGSDGTIYLVTGADYSGSLEESQKYYSGTFTGVFAIDGKTNKLKWKKIFKIRAGEGNIFFNEKQGIYLLDGSELHLIDKTGTEKWKYDFYENEKYRPRVPTIYFHDNGLIFWDKVILSSITGEKVADFNFDFQNIIGVLYWMDAGGNFYASGGAGKRLADGTFSPSNSETTYYKFKITNLSELVKFSDIIGSWAYGAIDRLDKAGIISGYPDGTFRPDATVSKEEFIKLLLTAKPVQSNNVVNNSFSDVPSSRWSYSVIQNAVSNGIVSVLEEGNKFYPTSPITREQMAVYVARVLQLPISGNPKSFTDAQDITNHPEMVLAAATNGIIGGYPDGSFKPKANLSRAEVAVVITRILDFKEI